MYIVVLASLALAVNFSFNLYSMEKPQRGLIGAFLHTMDKHADPISYITNNKSIQHCEAAVALLKDPSDPKHKKFERNQEWLGADGHINKIANRQNQLTIELEGAIFGFDNRWTYLSIFGTYREKNPATVEQLMKAYDIVPAIFSPHVLALLRSYSQQKIKKSEKNATTFQAFNLQQTSTVVAPEEFKKISDQQNYSDQITDESFRALVLNDNETFSELINNALRKNFDPIAHLTNPKTRIFGEQLLRYDPERPGHTELWNLNPDMPLHKWHVHKTLERERILNLAIAKAINEDDSETVIRLSSFNPPDPNQITITEGYFSDAFNAFIKGYLAKKASETTLDFKIQLDSKKPRLQQVLAKIVCGHAKSVQDCEICKKRLADTQNSLTNNNNHKCWCIPQKLLKDCPICIAVLKHATLPTPSPSIPDSPINPDGNCNCNPPKSLKSCPECLLAKLLQVSVKPLSVSETALITNVVSPQQKNESDNPYDSYNTADNDGS